MEKCLLLFIGLCLSTFPLFGQEIIESSSLPIVIIDTKGEFILDDPRIIAHMGIIANENGNRNLITDPFSEYDGRISIEIRGSSSQSFPKKSYGIETQKDSGENKNVSLLGMPKENDWILHGPFSDKSLLRNKLAFELGSKLSGYAPRTRLVELMINEDYRGIYVLMEKIKRDKNRVAISTLTESDLDEDTITGGYIIKLDKFTGSGGDGWTSDEGSNYQYEYPDAKDINFAQKDYIKTYVDEFEQALFSNLYQNSEEGYQKYIDIQSFIDFIIINELTKNVDGYRLSTYFHKDRGEKMKAGPMWDFNLAFGNANYCIGGQPQGWVLNFNQFCPEDGWTINTYWDRLLGDPRFGRLLNERWTNLRNGSFATDSILATFNSFLQEMDDAPARNFDRWPILDTWVWPNVEVAGNYQGEVNYLRNWILSRLSWMDENMPTISNSVIGPYSRPLVEVYPNPYTDVVHIRIRSALDQELRFEVFDMQGRKLVDVPIESQKGYDLFYQWTGNSLDGTKVSQGIYMYRILMGTEILENGKLIKQ